MFLSTTARAAALRVLRSALHSASCRPAHPRLRQSVGKRPQTRSADRFALERYEKELNRWNPVDGSLLGR